GRRICSSAGARNGTGERVIVCRKTCGAMRDANDCGAQCFGGNDMAIQWSSWVSLGKAPETDLGRPFAQRNQDGRLEVFALGLDGIFNIWQVVPNGGWSDGWRNKGRPSAKVRIKSHVVGRNADGRQEVFALGDDDALWQKWQ